MRLSRPITCLHSERIHIVIIGEFDNFPPKPLRDPQHYVVTRSKFNKAAHIAASSYTRRALRLPIAHTWLNYADTCIRGARPDGVQRDEFFTLPHKSICHTSARKILTHFRHAKSPRSPRVYDISDFKRQVMEWTCELCVSSDAFRYIRIAVEILVKRDDEKKWHFTL